MYGQINATSVDTVINTNYHNAGDSLKNSTNPLLIILFKYSRLFSSEFFTCQLHALVSNEVLRIGSPLSRFA